jgi:thioredoxin-related protein
MEQARMKVCTDCYSAFNELNKINFLEDWLISHETQIGVPIHDLYAEIQEQRDRLYGKPQLKQFYTKHSRELVLLEAVLKRIPFWEQNASLRPASLNLIRERMQQSIEELLAKLHIRSVPERSLSEIEILNYVIKAIPGWIDPTRFNARDAHALRSYIERQRETELRKLTKQIALHQYILDLIPHWMKESQVPTLFVRNLEKQIKSRNQRISASLPGRPKKVKRPSLLETITYTLDELPVWVDNLNISCEDPVVVKIQNYLIAQHQALLQPATLIQPVKVAVDVSTKVPPISIPTKPKRKTTPSAPAVPIRPPRPRINLKT